MYKVKVEKGVSKYIHKLGSKEREYFLERFDKLKYDKTGYRLLDRSGNVELWELRCQSHRVYYTVENQFIVIENVEYKGNIDVNDASNKNQQENKIKFLKKKYLRK